MPRRKFLPRVSKKQLVMISGALVALFIAANGTVWTLYRQRSYPNTTIAGKQLGAVSTKQLDAKIKNLHVLPTTVTLTHDNKPTTLPLSTLGISLDTAKTIDRVQHERHWLPMLNLVRSHHVDLYLQTDEGAFKKTLAGLSPTYTKPATDAAIVVGTGGFELHKDATGYQLDAANAGKVITNAVSRGKTTIALPTTTLTPKVTAASLQQSLQTLQAQQQSNLTFRYQGKSTKPSAQQIASWYDLNGPAFSLNDAKIKGYITQAGNGFGIGVQNANDAVNAVKGALKDAKPLDFTLVATPTRKTFSYCVALRGVDASNVGSLKNKLKSVYADERGWSLGGQLGFSEVSAGCNFTVWLTAAAQMTSFGPGCDSTWSCTVPPHVIINFDRWSGGSPAWNQSGGSLDDYRSMVINHETGHWLGFGHQNCPGVGQPAPVMQQQSIDLQGCTFNPWPLAAERNTLRAKLSL
jgi:hypothetical protein